MVDLEPTGGLKTCSKCGIEKPVTDFYKAPKREHRRPDCRTCSQALSRAWQKANPDRVKQIMRKHDLKRGYGITPEGHAQMLRDQDGRCLGCDRSIEFGVGPSAPAVDHCHKTGMIRGLLCQPCNFALGNVQDSPETLRRLATYLEKSLDTKQAVEDKNDWLTWMEPSAA